jgi:ATP-dependent Clp protease, protease subunit
MQNWYAIRARDQGAEVAIYDEIGAYGVSARAFLADLGALPDDAPLTLRLNSPGGSVFDAVAIYNALTRHAGGVTVWIDGIAASAASYIAMAGREVVMPENAFLMIHDPAGMVMGSAADMRAMAEALDKVKASLVAGYVAKSGGADAEIAELMSKETWPTAAEAVDLGFADRMAEPVRIAARFDIGRFHNAPPVLVEAVAEAFDDPPREAANDGEDSEKVADTEPALDPEATPEDQAAPDGGTIRAEALAHARAVVDLCTLAGLPQKAGDFLAAGATLEEARVALLTVRAEAAWELESHHAQPGRRSDARPWGEVIARTFKPRTIQ